MSIDANTSIEALRSSTVVSDDGSKIGKVGDVYLGDTSDQPEWVTVKTGLFGTSETFVPLADASSSGDEIRVPYSKDKVKDAPRTEADGQISVEEEGRLFSYYGVGGTTSTTGTTAGTTGTTSTGRGTEGRRDLAGQPGVQGRDTSGPTTDEAMTRSEERLHVGTEVRESGRARLRKHIVTEHQTASVNTSHEELTVTREPITDANRGAATSGSQLSEEEHEVVLHEEVPVVSKTVEAVERVRLGTQTEHETQTVSADVRKEQIELERDAERTTGRDGRPAGRDGRV